MKDFIEIDKKPVIFDDPKYCGDSGDCCDFINMKYGAWICAMFTKCDLVVDVSEKKVMKHPECKKEWKAAKERQSEPCHQCKNLRGPDEHGAYICPCPHCGDEVPF